ncbi:MAG: tetratricopeptide repeat protein, partial [Anaerolineales bacterium]|nr:tetratricopeptide repeat protein [Anaerolineales bacterium]
RQALAILEEDKCWSGIVQLRELFAGLLARDSAWGIPVIQELDEASIEAARHLGDAAKLGHLLGARGHNLHRQGFHEQAIAAFEESAEYYQECGEDFGALKSVFMTSLCYRALDNRVKSKEILDTVLQQVGPDDPWRGNPLQVMAWLTQDAGDLLATEELLRQVLALHEQATDSDMLVAGTLADLGEVVGLQNRFAEASEIFQRSLAILEQYRGQYDRQEARTKLKYAELMMHQKQFDNALTLLNDSDDKASGYGHYYDLMWRIELARVMIFARKGRIREAILKGQMVLRYRRILGLSNWLLVKQLWQRLRAGTGLPR